jgi:ethylbenzene dioxygenase alpha subunit
MAGAYFNAEQGSLSSEVFSSTRLYSDEIERLFARSWLLVAPLSWLQAPGDFVTSHLGRTPVLAWRTAEGIEVFFNTCLGSNERLTERERGRAEDLRCPCHRWSYSPLPAAAMNRPARVAKAESFGGFLFATCDPQAPPLRTWLGDFGWCWDLIADQFPGGIEVYGGRTLQTQLRCNWKLAAEAYAGDVYSDLTLTRNTREVLRLGAPLSEREGFQICSDAGAMVVVTDQARGTPPHAVDAMTPILATLFPNISYDGRAGALHVWRPVGALETVAQSYCLVGRDDAPAVKEARRRAFQQLCGPTGMLFEDYAGVWADVTRTAHDGAVRTLNLQMGLGRERSSNLPGRTSDIGSEMNQRAFYGWWQSRLAAPPLASSQDKVAMGRPGPRP